MTIYGVYEDNEYEQCVFVGTIPEIAKEFHKKENTLRWSACMHKRIEIDGHRKYHIYSLYKEAKDEQI